MHRYRSGARARRRRARTPSSARWRPPARAVAFSGLAVAIGLGALLFVPVPFIRSLGIGGLLVPLVSLAGVATLQPVLLAALGGPGAKRRGHATAGAGGSGFAGDGDAAAVARARARPRRPRCLPPPPRRPSMSRPARSRRSPAGRSPSAASSCCATGSGRGRRPDPDRRRHRARRAAPGRPRAGAAILRLVDTTAPDPEVQAVAYGKRTPVRRRERPLRESRSSSACTTTASPETRSLVGRLRDDLIPAARFPAGHGRRRGRGAARRASTSSRARTTRSPGSSSAVLLVTFVTLAYAFRSLVLPLQAVLLNLLSVAAAYGLLALVVEHGSARASSGSSRPTPSRPGFRSSSSRCCSASRWTTRCSSWRRCARRGTLATTPAGPSPHGLVRTGRIVTAAALIMVAVFSGFVAGTRARAAAVRARARARHPARRDDREDAARAGADHLGGRANWWLPALGGTARCAGSPSPL